MFEKIKIYNPHLDRDAFGRFAGTLLYSTISFLKLVTEQAAQRCYFKRVQSKILQNLQKQTCNRVLF